MALAAQTQYNAYTPTAGVVAFDYRFCCFDEDDLKVYFDDVLVAPSNYTVSGVGTRSGGSVTFTAAPYASSVTELLIKLVPSFARTNDYQQNGELLSDTLDDDIDRLYSLQQYNNSLVGRTLTFDDVTATDMAVVGDSTARASKLLGFDSNGDPDLLVPADLSLVTPTAYINTLLDDTTSAAARATLETVKNAREQEGIRYATAGTAPNFTVTTASPAVGAYATGQRFTVVFNADGTIGSNTINVNALGAKNIKQYDDAGNKRSGVCKSSQVAIVEYDGTDFVILNPLPVYPLTNVRQTVQGGPITSAGLPDFLPASSVNLTLTTQNLTTTPLVVSAAQGFGIGSDRIGTASANFAWTCTNSATNYLYLDIASTGIMTAGVTTTAPVYSQSLLTGTNTFNYTTMTMFSSGTTKAWRVFVGEAIAAGGAITDVYQYAYNGSYISAPFTYAANTQYQKRHNIGAPCTGYIAYYCATSEWGFAQYDEAESYSWFSASHYGTALVSDKTTSTVTVGAAIYLLDKTSVTQRLLDDAKWRLKLYVKRVF